MMMMMMMMMMMITLNKVAVATDLAEKKLRLHFILKTIVLCRHARFKLQRKVLTQSEKLNDRLF